MREIRHVAVVDIGKTNAKLALVDMLDRTETAVRKRPNDVLSGPPYPHYDTDGLWQFILDGLTEFQTAHGVDAITVTTHGACAALVEASGDLAAPILDYEYDGPDLLAHEYDSIRPDFFESGSPRLPLGLNLGAQLFWQFRTFPDIGNRTRFISTYPQYWTWRLTGVAANEVTSLGCHTDLWCPREKRYSSLVQKEGWERLMAPVRNAREQLGPIHGELAKSTGLNAATPVYCGIHDSNASLYAHLVSRQAPFSVVSTGTWVITMAIGGSTVELDPARDTLINVNALGDPVPSARFMGGREFERVMDGCEQNHTQSDIVEVIDRAIMLLPSIEKRSGPFQGREHCWTADENGLSNGQRFVAVSFYLALMTATGLEMTGARGATVVEGPFAGNPVYRAMLAAATGRPAIAVAGTGTSLGAALLTLPGRLRQADRHVDQQEPPAGMVAYARKWHEKVKHS